MILTFHSTSVPLTPEECATRTFATLDCDFIPLWLRLPFQSGRILDKNAPVLIFPHADPVRTLPRVSLDQSTYLTNQAKILTSYFPLGLTVHPRLSHRLRDDIHSCKILQSPVLSVGVLLAIWSPPVPRRWLFVSIGKFSGARTAGSCPSHPLPKAYAKVSQLHCSFASTRLFNIRSSPFLPVVIPECISDSGNTRYSIRNPLRSFVASP